MNILTYLPGLKAIGLFLLLVIISLIVTRFRLSELSGFLNIFRKKDNVMKIVISAIILILSVIFMRFLSYYAESWKFPPVGDVFHDLLPLSFAKSLPFDINYVSTLGYLLIIFIIAFYLMFKKPDMLSKFMITVALFCVVRGLFIAMTHQGAPYPQIADHDVGGLFRRLYFTNDLFPSGHVAMPYLGYLFLRDDRKMGIFLLLTSVIMGLVVLMMHGHYSIDVFGAYFIAYGVFYLSKNYLWRYFRLK